MDSWRFKKIARFADVKVIAGFFTDGIIDGFKTLAPYGDVTDSPMKMPTESPMDSKRLHHTVTCLVCWQISRRNHRRNNPSVKPSVKVNISPLTRPYPPYFSFFFLISTLPNCKQPAPPPTNNFPLLSTISYISWSLLVTASVFWFTDGFLLVFISNSILLNFNI